MELLKARAVAYPSVLPGGRCPAEFANLKSDTLQLSGAFVLLLLLYPTYSHVFALAYLEQIYTSS
jgi:hypothetical protein